MSAWEDFSTHFYFYPRPPRGGRHEIYCKDHKDFKFLSTPSARRATTGQKRVYRRISFLSTPSARRATLTAIFFSLLQVISIHALREEGDPCVHLLFLKFSIFLSTPSARRATLHGQAGLFELSISIHALREEGDV